MNQLNLMEFEKEGVVDKVNVLDHGFVKLVDMMGDDYSILRAARVSTGSDAVKGDDKDRALIRYLYRNDHISPFSFVSFHFYVKCPIFVARQWFRHRTFDFNEVSARYKELKWEVFYPDSWRKQSSVNKQGSSEKVKQQFEFNEMVENAYRASEIAYRTMIELGEVSREQARTVMPVGQYTEFYAHINLRNLFHFLELRLDPHAQYEIRVYAKAILNILEDIPSIRWSVEVFKDYYNLNQVVKGLKESYKNDVKGLTERLNSSMV